MMKPAARAIAFMIKDTPSEDRGVLLYDIAEALRDMDQHFTAKLFDKIAVKYSAFNA